MTAVTTGGAAVTATTTTAGVQTTVHSTADTAELCVCIEGFACVLGVMGKEGRFATHTGRPVARQWEHTVRSEVKWIIIGETATALVDLIADIACEM